jgi:recombination protein RecA
LSGETDEPWPRGTATGKPTATAPRPSTWRSRRSKSSTARARSCVWAARAASSRSRRSLPARWPSTTPWGSAAFVDAEHALDITFARRIGVDVDNLIISQPDSGEQALEIVETLVRSGAFDIIVLDSVAALVPQAELEGDMGDSHMGLHARLMSQALRKLTGSISRSRTCAIFINQLRMKIGVMFGNPETTTGGRAMGFYASVRVDIRRVGHIKDGETSIGSRVRIKIAKNKLAPPYRQAEFDIYYAGESIGISRESDLLDFGVEYGLIDKSGTWFSCEGERLGQGRENARQFLADNPELAATVESRLRVELGLDAAEVTVADEDAGSDPATDTESDARTDAA